MNIEDYIMGRNQIDAWSEFKKRMKNRIDKVKDIKDERKRVKEEKKIKMRVVKFIRELYKLGVEVYDNNDKMITGYNDLDKLELNFIYDEYVFKTLEEVDKRVKEYYNK